MTDNTQPEAREFTMSQYASKDDMIGAMRKRIAELESELEAVGAGGVNGPMVGRTSLQSPGFDAADMATASAQGFRDGVASLSANAGEPDQAIYQLSPPDTAHDTITKIINELRTYNPQADECGGKFIHKGWANQLEAVAPPQISESDASYWLRNRALILRAIEERGFRLVSSGGLFWLSGTAPPTAQAGWWTKPQRTITYTRPVCAASLERRE